MPSSTSSRPMSSPAEGVAEERLTRLQANVPAVAHAPDFPVQRVVWVRPVFRVRARRRAPEGARCAVADAFVRPLVVIALAEGVEATLLGAQAAGGRPGRLALALAMHPFVGAVLLWTRRRDALMHDAELHPPDVQRRQAVNACGGERRAVVSANGVRQSHLAEERSFGRLAFFASTVLTESQALAGQHPATEVIRHPSGPEPAVLTPQQCGTSVPL